MVTPLRYVLAVCLLLCAYGLAAQDDIEIRVHHGPAITLLPDTDMIIDGVSMGFVVKGVTLGCKLRASLSRGELQVYDTALTITTHINPSIPDSNTPPATITLHLQTFDKKGIQVSTLDKTFIIIPPLEPVSTPFIPPPPRRPNWTPKISFSGFHMITWKLRQANVLKNTLTKANERMIRHNVGSSFYYSDTSRGGIANLQRFYRAIDLKINLNGIQRNMHSNGSSISMLMSEELRKQQGRSDFTLLLHRRYARGSRVDIVDTVQYKAPVSSSIFLLKK